jgi:hypothetical protein
MMPNGERGKYGEVLDRGVPDPTRQLDLRTQPIQSFAQGKTRIVGKVNTNYFYYYQLVLDNSP